MANRVIRALRSLFRRALGSERVAAERITRSRCVRITLPEIQSTQIQVLSPTQVRTLASAMDPHYAITVIAGYGLGLRQGEALALCRSRIDFQHHTYRVDRQVVTHARPGTHTNKQRTGQKLRNSTAPTATRTPHTTPVATRIYAELQLET